MYSVGSHVLIMPLSSAKQKFAYTLNLYGSVYYASPTQITGRWSNLDNSLSVNGYTDLGTSSQPLPLGGITLSPNTKALTLDGNDIVNSTLRWDYSKGSRDVFSFSALLIGSNSILDMGSGDDLLGGAISLRLDTRYTPIISNQTYVGIENYGTILMGLGADRIQCALDLGFYSPTPPKDVVQYAMYNAGTIDLGSGNDSISVNNVSSVDKAVGLYNSGTIILGDGSDAIWCYIAKDTTSTIAPVPKTYYGILNDGSIYLGEGSNFVSFKKGNESTQATFANRSSGAVYGGGFIDKIAYDKVVNSGLIDLGAGDDLIRGSYIGENALGVTSSVLNMGEGNDEITGFVSCGNATIYMGAGDDLIDVTTGPQGSQLGMAASAAAPAGIVDLGSGNDALKGFAKGIVYGSSGIDKYLLAPGGYQMTVYSDRFEVTPLLSSGLPSNETTILFGFEKVGSTSSSGSLFSPFTGQILLNGNGSYTQIA